MEEVQKDEQRSMEGGGGAIGSYRSCLVNRGTCIIPFLYKKYLKRYIGMLLIIVIWYTSC